MDTLVNPPLRYAFYIFISSILFSVPSATFADTVKISKPSISGYRLDYCREWGKNCGSRAATAYCRSIGHEKHINFKIDKDIGDKTPTKVINGGQKCSKKYCDGFKSISCKLKGVSAKSPNKYLPKKGSKKSGEQDPLGAEGKSDSAFSHELPAGAYKNYDAMADASIKSIAGRHKLNSANLIKEIEKGCSVGSPACHLEVKLEFLKNYLEQ